MVAGSERPPSDEVTLKSSLVTVNSTRGKALTLLTLRSV